LETLLRYLETETLILTGVAGNFCVLFTANDAYMRNFNLFVPSDCTVSNTKQENESALRIMKKFLKAEHTAIFQNHAASCERKKIKAWPMIELLPKEIFLKCLEKAWLRNRPLDK